MHSTQKKLTCGHAYHQLLFDTLYQKLPNSCRYLQGCFFANFRQLFETWISQQSLLRLGRTWLRRIPVWTLSPGQGHLVPGWPEGRLVPNFTSMEITLHWLGRYGQLV